MINDAQAFEGDSSRKSNFEQIASRSMVPVLTRVRHDADTCDNEVDWMAIAKKTAVLSAEC